MFPDRDELLCMSDEELSSLCKISFVKGSGPGGQKRNKTSSAVKVELPELTLSAGDCTERSQFRNRANALHKLRMQIAVQFRQVPAAIPDNMNCSLSSPAYPLFAAQLLDTFAEEKCDHRKCAEKCGISASALLKKLYRDPRLWQKVRQMRQDSGLGALNPPK